MDKQLMKTVHDIVECIDNKMGTDIVILDLRGISTICDYFIIASGKSIRQTKSIADEVEDQLFKKGIAFSHKEGYNNGRWILLDYGDIVVHIFHHEDRMFYDIERIWKDAEKVYIDKK